MAKSELLKAGAIATIAALMALTSMPSSAMAQDRGQGRGPGNRDGAAAAQTQSRPSQSRPTQARPSWGGREAQTGTQERASPPQRARTDNSGSGKWGGRDSDTARSDREQHQSGERRAEQRRVTPSETRNQNWNRPGGNRPAPVQNSDPKYREANRNDNWNDANRGHGSDRNGWKDNRRDEPVRYQNGRVTSPRRDDDRRWSYNNGRYNWNRDWRSDRRYDWNNHRQSYRHVYSPGRYRAPYSSYYYRPLGIGHRLNAPFYGNSYWISDPWDYRLPQAYGPYRWVRYFDDVLLVNTHNGTVTDVIRNFFW